MKTPLRSHPLLGQWTGQPKHYALHLPHGTSPSTKTWSASGPQKEHQRKYSHPTHRDCSEEMLNSTFHHEHLTPSLVPTARYSWKANHNTWPQPLIWNNPANVHNKATASHQTAQHISRNLKMRPLRFGLCLRQKLYGGLRDRSSQNTILVVGFFFPTPFWLALDFYGEFEMQTLLQATEPRKSPLPGACSNRALCRSSYLKQHCWKGFGNMTC